MHISSERGVWLHGRFKEIRSSSSKLPMEGEFWCPARSVPNTHQNICELKGDRFIPLCQSHLISKPLRLKILSGSLLQLRGRQEDFIGVSYGRVLPLTVVLLARRCQKPKYSSVSFMQTAVLSSLMSQAFGMKANQVELTKAACMFLPLTIAITLWSMGRVNVDWFWRGFDIVVNIFHLFQEVMAVLPAKFCLSAVLTIDRSLLPAQTALNLHPRV